MTPLPRIRGFTIIEVLVAMTIMAATFAVLFRIFASVTTSTRVAAEYRYALAVAESKMAELSADYDFLGGERTGVDGDIRWRQRVNRLESSTMLRLPGKQQLHQLQVDAFWYEYNDEKRVSISTIRFRDYVQR